MIIREAQAKDNEKLIAMEKKSAQGSLIRLSTERKDFFYRAKKFQEPIFLVAEDDNSTELLGAMGVGPVDIRIKGKYYRGGYIFDWRSNPLTKGLGRGMLRIWQALQTHLETNNIDFIFGYVKEDNLRSMKIATRSGCQIIGEKQFFIMPTHRKFASNIKGVNSEKEIDVTQDIEEKERHFKDFDLFPYPNHQQITNNYQSFLKSKISYQDSAMKIWDSSSEYRFRVLKIPPLFNVVRPAFSLIAPLISVPRIPKKDSLVNMWFLFDLTCNSEQDLAIMLEKTRRLAQKDNIDLLVYVHDVAEKEYPLIRKRSWINFKYKLLFMNINNVPLPQSPTYYDISYI